MLARMLPLGVTLELEAIRVRTLIDVWARLPQPKVPRSDSESKRDIPSGVSLLERFRGGTFRFAGRATVFLYDGFLIHC